MFFPDVEGIDLKRAGYYWPLSAIQGRLSNMDLYYANKAYKRVTKRASKSLVTLMIGILI